MDMIDIDRWMLHFDISTNKYKDILKANADMVFILEQNSG